MARISKFFTESVARDIGAIPTLQADWNERVSNVFTRHDRASAAARIMLRYMNLGTFDNVYGVGAGAICVAANYITKANRGRMGIFDPDSFEIDPIERSPLPERELRSAATLLIIGALVHGETARLALDRFQVVDAQNVTGLALIDVTRTRHEIASDRGVPFFALLEVAGSDMIRFSDDVLSASGTETTNC